MDLEILDVEYTPGDCSQYALITEKCSSIPGLFLPTAEYREAARACTRYTDAHHAAWSLAYSNPQLSHARQAGNTHLHGTCQYGQGCNVYTPEAEALLVLPLGPCGHQSP